MERLGLAKPVRGSQPSSKIVEIGRDLRMVGAEALLINRQRSPIERLGLAQPVCSAQQPGQIVERGRDVWMIRAKALFGDRQRPKIERLGLVQPVCSAQQPGQIVERIATVGCSGSKLFSSIASARRWSGSASPSRFASMSNRARLLRSVATSG